MAVSAPRGFALSNFAPLLAALLTWRIWRDMLIPRAILKGRVTTYGDEMRCQGQDPEEWHAVEGVVGRHFDGLSGFEIVWTEVSQEFPRYSI